MDGTHIIALEIGSSKIKGAIGHIDPHGSLSVKYVEEERITDIVRYGCILNVVETATAVRNVIERLQARVAPRRIQRIHLSVGGRSLKAEPIEIERRFSTEREITRELLAEITDEALGRSFSDREIIGAVPLEIRVNNTPTTRAVGMYGSHIAVRLNLLSVRSRLCDNLNRVIEQRLGLQISGDPAVRPVAQADLVLSPEEKRRGCMLVDFGAETTTVSIYRDGGLRYLSTIPLGSRNITRDITALNHLEERAEELKISQGSAVADNSELNQYVAARATEIIANINEQITYAGLTPAMLPDGIVIIGKGARLNGFVQRLEEYTGMRVRIGTVSSRIRILDGRALANDCIDVISILADAARNNPAEGLSALPKPEPAPAHHTQADPYSAPLYRTAPQQPQPQQYAQPQQSQYAQPQQPQYAQPQQPAAVHTAPVTPQPEPKPEPKPEPVYTAPKRRSLYEKIRNKVSDLLTENLYETDED